MENEFSLQSVVTLEQVQELINQSEPSIGLQEKGLLSLNGLNQSSNDLLFKNIYSRFSKFVTMR